MSGNPNVTYTLSRNTAINQSWLGSPDVNCTLYLVGGKPDLSNFKINITGSGYPSKTGTISAASVNALLDAGYHGLIGINMSNTGLSNGCNYFTRNTAITNLVYSNDMHYDFVIW